MSTFSDVYDELDVNDITKLVSDISPYVRARGSSFPAIIFSIPEETFDRQSTGTFRVQAAVEVQCLARSVQEAEDIADAVLEVVFANCANYVESITREYDEAYDDDSVGVFIVNINYLKNYMGA